MLKKLVNKILILLVLAVVNGRPLSAETSLDGERLNLETQLQTRVEEALSKIIPRSQFLVVIRVEPVPKIVATKETISDNTEGFYLPGVPTIRKYDGSNEALNRLTQELRPEREVYLKFIKRITVTLVLDQVVPDEVVTKVRDLTRQLVGLDPARGDTLDIQKTTFHRPAVNPDVPETTVSKFQKGLKEYWVVISLSLLLFCITVFFLFIFGPLRGFLNRFLQVLPTLRGMEGGGRPPMAGLDPQLLPALMAQTMGLLPQAMGQGGGEKSFSGSFQVENPSKRITPFSFIREDNLSNLAILLSHEAPDKAAVVLGYLPTEWISRVMSKLENSLQTEITAHLATTRQLLPEQVEDIEQDLKRRLDYMVGGPERIYSVYDSLDQDAQRRMLDSLKISRPEIADELRKRSFFFEDLEKLDSVSLKAVLREVDLLTLVVSLRGLDEGFLNRILEHLSEGKAEIVKQELDLGSDKPAKATLDAQKKISLIARRLVKEGPVQIVQLEDSSPATRYGNLRNTLKLPPGLAFKESQKTPTQEAEVVPQDSNSIQERIRRFMSRRHSDERFPGSGPAK